MQYAAAYQQPRNNYNGSSTYTAGNTAEYYLSFYVQTTGAGEGEHTHSYTANVVAPTCTENGYTTYTCSCGDNYTADEVAALGHTFVDGKCTACGAEDPDYVKPDEPVTGPVTASKEIKDLIAELGWTSSTTKQEFNLDENVTVKIDGGSNSGKAYNGDHIRVYATDTPAGTITINVAEGYELVSIKVTTVTGTYAFLYVDGTTTDICNVTTAVSGSSVVLKSVKNGSNGKQVRVLAIEVVYQPVA